jgi:hypothetical protein
MPFSIIPPLSVPYNGSINTLAVAKSAAPREGNKSIPININWGYDAGLHYSVKVSVQSQQIVTIQEIKTLYINNTSNIFDVSIFFQDTQQYINVPAGSQGYYPVITGLLEFTTYLTDSQQVETTWGMGGTGIGVIGNPPIKASTLITILNYYTDITLPDNKPELLGRTFLNTVAANYATAFDIPGTFTTTPVLGPFPIILNDLNISIASEVWGSFCWVEVHIQNFGGADIAHEIAYTADRTSPVYFQNVLYEGHDMFMPLLGLNFIITVGYFSAYTGFNGYVNISYSYTNTTFRT